MPTSWWPRLVLSASLAFVGSPIAPAQARPKQPWEHYPALLIGRWQSLQDPRSVLLITRTTYQEKYPGFPDSQLTYRITNACPDPDAPATKSQVRDVLVTRDASTATSYCYGINELTASHLTLLYFGRGNSLRFKRLE
ncbi:MAG: hypothetical protein ACRYFK_20320 [Janthinobacterium lividum]